MSTILITGGTGLIGRELSKSLLQKGHQVILLTRSANAIKVNDGIEYSNWNPENEKIDPAVVSRADVIIHLAGAGVAEKRWSRKRKQEIINSRVKSSRLLVKTLETIPNKVQAVISASAIGWYGPDPESKSSEVGQHSFQETDPPSDDFLGQTCFEWERSIRPVEQLNKRLVILRTGIVLSKEGGALKELIKPLNWGIAAIPGNGKQMVSWIHIQDIVSIILTAIENKTMEGVYNAVAPEPVSMKEMIIRFSKGLKKIYIPVKVPSFLLKAVLGEMSVEVLKSTTVSCKKLMESGYSFRYPVIGAAVSSLTE